MNFRRLKWLLEACCALVLLALITGGCRREETSGDGRTPPNPNAPALYGPPTGTASKAIQRAIPAGETNTSWQSAPFYVLQTELSPATLVHCATNRLGLFTGLTNYGLSAPTFIAWATRSGPRVFKRGEGLDATNMVENWVLVWWAGAKGWTEWDCPWAVYLQHRPDAMNLDEGGLHFQFPRTAGDVVMMPLYGYDKPPQEGRDFRSAHGLPAPKVPIKTWEWPKVITRDPLTRIRYWAAATRELPVHCEESFSVKRARDSVTLRTRVKWRSIPDDWKTRRIKLAPLSPPLAHAAKLGGFPVSFSERWFDLEMPTPYGPLLAVESTDSFDATFPILQYINETEAFDPPNTGAHPVVQAAQDKLQQIVSQPLNRQSIGWAARALPYCNAATRSNVVAGLRGQIRSLLESAKGNAAAGMIESLWACAHFTGDWEPVKEHWPVIKTMFTTPAQTRWAGFGGQGVSEIAAEAARCAAFARMAYKVGDMDSYDYACHIFARQLTLLFVKQSGTDYFRRHQPWHSMDFMDEEVFLSDLQSDGTGWHIDGPKFPVNASDRRFDQRWARFDDNDAARFYRDHLKEDVRRELNWLQHRQETNRLAEIVPVSRPSFVQLRSLLLNETPAELAAIPGAGQFSGSVASLIADCLSLLRTSHPTRFERLIPAGEPSPFVTGLEREASEFGAALLTTVQFQSTSSNDNPGEITWPELTWPRWRTPTGAVWTFGQVRPGSSQKPLSARTIPLSWNSRVIVFELQ